MTKEEIENIVDKLILNIPVDKDFDLVYELSLVLKKYSPEINLNTDKTNIIEDVSNFMIENEYIKYNPKNLNDKLEKKGVEVKKIGGYFKYLESLESIKKREEKQDKLLDLDLKLKTFESKIEKKLFVAGFIITFLSFLITILTVQFSNVAENKNEQKNQVSTPLKHNKENK